MVGRMAGEGRFGLVGRRVGEGMKFKINKFRRRATEEYYWGSE